LRQVAALSYLGMITTAIAAHFDLL
jgi:hypothetical protein